MPARGYKSVTLKEDLYKELAAFAEERGMSVAEAIKYLITTYKDFLAVIKKNGLLKKIGEEPKMHELEVSLQYLEMRIDMLSRRLNELEEKIRGS